MGDDAAPASPSVTFGESLSVVVETETSTDGAPVENTSNPLEIVLPDDVEEGGLSPEALRREREAGVQAGLRSSILKPGEGPVVSPRNMMTRTLSFVDQTEDARPLKEVRLYERDPKPGQPGRPGSLLGPPEEDEENATQPIMIAVGISILLVRTQSPPIPHAAVAASSALPLAVLYRWDANVGDVEQFLIWLVTGKPG